jgi:nucleoside-diphosphate-sugar epimerase
MYRRVPDTTKLERAIGWQPSRSLDQILSDVLADTHVGDQTALVA